MQRQLLMLTHHDARHRVWQVCSGGTGHTEAVQLIYDPKEVSSAPAAASLY